jgi:hypothetical protein
MAGSIGEATAASPPRRRDVLAPWAAFGAVAGTWLALAAAGPTDDGRVLCPWRLLTGLDCPFCGSTRAAAALAHGDVVAALDHNALFVLAVLPLALAAWAVWVTHARAGRPLPTISTRALVVAFVVVGGWWVVRLLVPWLGSGASV